MFYIYFFFFNSTNLSKIDYIHHIGPSQIISIIRSFGFFLQVQKTINIYIYYIRCFLLTYNY